jgi:hypothetical protein
MWVQAKTKDRSQVKIMVKTMVEVKILPPGHRDGCSTPS